MLDEPDNSVGIKLIHKIYLARVYHFEMPVTHRSKPLYEREAPRREMQISRSQTNKQNGERADPSLSVERAKKLAFANDALCIIRAGGECVISSSPWCAFELTE